MIRKARSRTSPNNKMPDASKEDLHRSMISSKALNRSMLSSSSMISSGGIQSKRARSPRMSNSRRLSTSSTSRPNSSDGRNQTNSVFSKDNGHSNDNRNPSTRNDCRIMAVRTILSNNGKATTDRNRALANREETNSHTAIKSNSVSSVAPGSSIALNTGIPTTAIGSSVADTVATAFRRTDSADTLAQNMDSASTVSLFWWLAATLASSTTVIG